MFFNNIFNMLSKYLHKDSDYITVTIILPKEVILRTQLICNYISEEEDCYFDLNSFLLLLYLDFIKDCIEKYDPKKVLQRLTYNYLDKKPLIITNGYEKYQLNSTSSYYEYNINFEKTEASKGELILDELHELFHCHISFNTLIEQLWVSFIYRYKTGENKKAFAYLRRILKENIT
ncbi:hypothetical protein OD350_29290 (plasmid) [Clostridium beijerinckii]|uniref:hypothetical protein n=1 Tax=Clostridium beijerinckii TaxID=1520 RepID=UPI002226768C|nr:hypothetical protein [Clostridium beijerinckii]UYZ38984.1 hypothetical protein OD350_29290 [Clostridium beijerinckii]